MTFGSLGLEPRAHEAGPGAVNAAVFNLMRQISLLYGPRGVTTHTLSPAPADTPRLRRIVAAVAAERGAAEEDVWQEYVAQNSLGGLPTADELAWAVEVLLLDQEGRHPARQRALPGRGRPPRDRLNDQPAATV